MGEHYKTNISEYSILTTKRLWRNPQSFYIWWHIINFAKISFTIIKIGSVEDFLRISLQTPRWMKLSSNRDVLKDASRCFISIVFSVALLDTSHMAQPGTDQYRDRVVSGKLLHHMSMVMIFCLTYQSLIGSDASPVFTGKLQ